MRSALDALVWAIVAVIVGSGLLALLTGFVLSLIKGKQPTRPRGIKMD